MRVPERGRIPCFLSNANRLGLEYVLAATFVGTAIAQDRGLEDAVPLKSIWFDPTALGGIPVFASVVSVFESVRWRKLIVVVRRVPFARHKHADSGKQRPESCQ